MPKNISLFPSYFFPFTSVACILFWLIVCMLGFMLSSHFSAKWSWWLRIFLAKTIKMYWYITIVQSLNNIVRLFIYCKIKLKYTVRNKIEKGGFGGTCRTVPQYHHITNLSVELSMEEPYMFREKVNIVNEND